MVDQQEALERQRELYQEKNEHLERFLEPVAPYEFYREIFPFPFLSSKCPFLSKEPSGNMFLISSFPDILQALQYTYIQK